MKDFWIYLLILAGSTYLIRAIPFAAMRKKINNRFIKSFLYYIPYAVLSAMTLPAAFYATGNVISGAVGLVVGGIFAYKGKGLTLVAIVSCVAAFLTECVLRLITRS
ncbi:MAG: AzlD domain-containing protein [Clostridia bacterium]|nr:AzlD domain-containing protein [Clostridia bacterium]